MKKPFCSLLLASKVSEFLSMSKPAPLFIFLLGVVLYTFVLAPCSAAPLYVMPETIQTRWISFENPDGTPGAGAQANRGAKGAAFEAIAAGEEKLLLNVEGPGIIHRMWCTLSQRSPRDLRSYLLRIYWDHAERPAVELPFADFFCAVHGEVKAFENALFSSAEGRSFSFTIDMPFKTHARMTLTNESSEELQQFFFDVNYSKTELPESSLYFHASWRRERYTQLTQDFEILPKIQGRGRYLGTHIGIIGHPDNVGWWGEGEVKIYLDGDQEFPTLVGTGTEDYVGTAYFQGEYAHQYEGSLLIDDVNKYYAFYRYHVPDPVYFHQEIRVTLQQIGGAMQEFVKEMLEKGVEILPVSVGSDGGFVPLLEGDTPKTLDDPGVPYGWTNYYRRDDVCAAVFFYLDQPENQLPPLAPLEERLAAVGERVVNP